MTDICMALDQSVSPHTGVRTIQNTGVFWQAVFQPPRPYSLFLEHGSAAKTFISHQHSNKRLLEKWRYTRDCCTIDGKNHSIMSIFISIPEKNMQS